MADQHLDFCPVTSEAWHFADGVEEIRVNVIILDGASGPGDLNWSSRGVGGFIFNMEFLQLTLIDRNTGNGVQWNIPWSGRSGRTDKRGKLSLPSAITKILNNPNARV